MLALNNAGTEPEKNETFELGAKWDLFNGGSRLARRLFQIDKTNARTTDPVLGVQVTDGRQRVQRLRARGGGPDPAPAGTSSPATPTSTRASSSRSTSRPASRSRASASPTCPSTRRACGPPTTSRASGRWAAAPSSWTSATPTPTTSTRRRRYVRGDVTVAYRPIKPLELRFNILNVADERYFDAGPSRPRRSRARRGRSCSPAPGGSDRAMLLHVPKVLTEAQVARCRELMERAKWVDGRDHGRPPVGARPSTTCSSPRGRPEAREMGEMIVAALERNPLFISAALPAAGLPAALQPLRAGHGLRRPRGQRDPAGRRARRSACAPTSRPRSSSAAPEEYDGGELVVEDTYGAHSVKLPAGDMILYPATSLHRVQPVTRGARARLVLLDPEHGARRRRAHAALRPRHGDQPGERRPRRTTRGVVALTELLPQPAAPLGGRLRSPSR